MSDSSVYDPSLLSEPVMSEQEKGLRRVLAERNLAQPGSVNYRMHQEFVSCSEDAMVCTTRYFLGPEMANPLGWLHGGVTATMFDMGMGMLAYYHKNAICPTASMTVNYLRPNKIGGYFVVRTQLNFNGKKILHLTAEGWMEDEPEKLTATACGSYSVIGPSQQETFRDKLDRIR